MVYTRILKKYIKINIYKKIISIFSVFQFCQVILSFILHQNNVTKQINKELMFHSYQLCSYLDFTSSETVYTRV